MSLTLKSIAATARELKTSAPAPAPEAETVTISKAAFDEAMRLIDQTMKSARTINMPVLENQLKEARAFLIYQMPF